MANTITLDMLPKSEEDRKSFKQDKLEVNLDDFKEELTVTLTIEPDDDMFTGFIEMMVSGYSDIFGSYIGYWARGLHYDEERHCWLCLEHGDEFRLEKDQEDFIVDHYKKNPYAGSRYFDNFGEAPIDQKVHVFVMDLSFAMRAVASVVTNKGMSEMSNWDANTVDIGVQYALFGKLIYG